MEDEEGGVEGEDGEAEDAGEEGKGSVRVRVDKSVIISRVMSSVGLVLAF